MARQDIPKLKSLEVPANTFKRVLAFLVDLLIIDLVVFFPFRMLFSRIVPDMSFSSLSRIVENPEFTEFFMVVTFAMGILAVLYFAILEYRLHQTVGKILFRIRVKSEKKQLNLWQCIVRSIFLFPVAPLVVLWLADVIYALFNQKRQRLLEIISKTMTVETVIGV